MVDDRHKTALTVSPTLAERGSLRNKTVNVPAIRRGEEGASDYVSHLTPGDVKLLVLVASRDPRHGERNAALISLIFDGALRVSEALGVRPVDIEQTPDGYIVSVMGKGSKPGRVAVTASTAQMLFALAYHQGTAPTDRLIPITRSQVFRVVADAFRSAGVRQPSRLTDHVGAVHVLRHSGALARLAASGNPKSVQNQLRHKSAQMTLRYMKTLSADESLAIQEKVNPW
jgi:integrase/recombinase XerD